MTFDPTQDESAAADNGEALPARLRADLARLHPVPAVPSGVDAAVRAAGRAYLARQRRVRLWTRAGAAIAATIVTCVGLRLALPPAGPGEAGPGVAGGSAPAGRPP
ncbi:MAG: hypothetical protein JWO31_3313, partial [Phycisphaerales bacterium]|nr:hypothetical protein [Phycisphaerales bacterium]